MHDIIETLQVVRAAQAPESPLTPWQWAEQNIKSIPYSPIPGAFYSGHSPWMREPLEALVDPRVKIISIIAAVQASKTTIPEIGLCFIIPNLPGPCLWLDNTDSEAKDQSESRLQPLFDQCEPVSALYPRNRYRKKNAAIHFANGMSLWILGGNNKTNLQRRSIRWLIGDETWRWPAGHMAEAEARVTAFGWLGKCIFTSQGGFAGDDTHSKFETTDQREWTVCCQGCGERWPLEWKMVEWPEAAKIEDGIWDFAMIREQTRLRCPTCGHLHDDTDRTRRQLNLTGRFVAQNPQAAAENVGFHWNALCAMSWGKLAEMYLRAKSAARRGDITHLQTFWQKRLALPWTDASEDFDVAAPVSAYEITTGAGGWTDEAGYSQHGELLPAPVDPAARMHRCRVLAVDVQMDHFFAIVRSFAADGSSRLLHVERLVTWEDVDRLATEFEVSSHFVFIDAGYNTYEVYRRCNLHRWTALMGDARETYYHPNRKGKGGINRVYSPARKVAVGRGVARLHYWSNLAVKDILHRLRQLARADGQPFWQIPANAPEEYLRHLESEERIKRGGKFHWVQIGKRPNHYLDCEAMAIAAACMMKLLGNDGAAVDNDGGKHERRHS